MRFLSKLLKKAPRVQPTEVRDLDSFDAEVLGSSLPVIVDVWSHGCPPCRQLEPIIVEVASRYAGRVRVAEVAAHEAPDLTRHLGVRSTPTIIIYDKGEELGRASGFRPSTWFDEMIAAEFPHRR